MNTSKRDPNQFMEWMFNIGNWWDIICGNDCNASNKLLHEILQKLIDDSMYELAFVLLKTHEANRTIEYAMSKAVSDFADEQFMKNYLSNIANHLKIQNQKQ